MENLPNKEKDSLGLVYLGWAELAGNRYAAAEKAFNRALGLNGKLLAAQLGVAQTKEAAGDRAAANKAYTKALNLKPDHFNAVIGALRTSEDPGAENRMIDALKKYNQTLDFLGDQTSSELYRLANDAARRVPKVCVLELFVNDEAHRCHHTVRYYPEGSISYPLLGRNDRWVELHSGQTVVKNHCQTEGL
mgnify:CR=1 FL=1